jgi:hypothetical protein
MDQSQSFHRGPSDSDRYAKREVDRDGRASRGDEERSRALVKGRRSRFTEPRAR